MIYTTLTTCRISGVLFAEKPYEKNTRIILLIFFQISTWVRRHKQFIKQNNTGLQTGFASLSVTSFVSPCMGGKQQGDLWHRWLTLTAPSDNLCWKWRQLPVMLTSTWVPRLDPWLYYDNVKDFSHPQFNSKRENELDFFGVGHVILTYNVTTHNSIS